MSVETFTVDADDNIDLDIRALKREGTNSGTYVVEIDRIAAGNTADVQLQQSVFQTGDGSAGGVDVDSPYPPEGTPATRLLQLLPPRFGRPFPALSRGLYATTESSIDVTTYDFRGIDPVRDVRELAGLQAGAVTDTGDIIVKSVDQTRVRSARSTCSRSPRSPTTVRTTTTATSPSSPTASSR